MVCLGACIFLILTVADIVFPFLEQKTDPMGLSL